MPLINAIEADELAALCLDWGDVPRQHHDLNVEHPFLSGRHQMLASHGRRAEICYVMHRGDPGGDVLLHIKTIYPDGAYRLPTGGIHQGDGVTETLQREIFEETGLTVGERIDQVRVERLLGVVSYRFRHPALGEIDFATYPFLVRMPDDAVLAPQDPTEMIAGWRWQPTPELIAVADYLENVAEVDPQWRDWGRYRALVHRFVAGLGRGGN